MHVILSILLVLLLISGCKPKVNLGSNVLAKVDEDVITVDDFKAVNPEISKDFKERQALLNTMIQNLVIARKAHSENIYNDPEVLGQIEYYYSEELPGLLRKDVSSKVVVSDEELARAVKQPAPVMTVSLLMAQTLQDAESALAEIKKGVPFEKVSTKVKDIATQTDVDVSLDSQLYPVGVRAVINGLKPGAVSPIMKMEIGYAIFKLTSRKSSEDLWKSQKEAKAKEIKELKTNEEMEKLVKKLWSESDIKTNKDLFRLGSDKSWGAKVDDITIKIDPGMIQASGDPHEPHQAMKAESVMTSIDNMITRYLLSREARKRGLQNDPEFRRKLKFKTEDILAQTFIDRTKGNYTVSDAEIQDYYNKNKDRLAYKKACRLSRILLDNKDVADRVYAQLKSGKDFAKLAKEESKDTVTRDRGGDMGIIVVEGLKEPMKSAITNLKAGEYTAPIRSDYGFEILKATEIKETAAPPLAEVRETVRKRVLLNKQSDRIEHVYKELLDKAKVQINEELLRSL